MRGTIGPCSQGTSACRQMWWWASTIGVSIVSTPLRPAARGGMAQGRAGLGKIAEAPRPRYHRRDGRGQGSTAMARGRRREGGSAASGVTQTSRQERAASRRTACAISPGSPRSSPSESTIATAPREARRSAERRGRPRGSRRCACRRRSRRRRAAISPSARSGVAVTQRPGETAEAACRRRTSRPRARHCVSAWAKRR